MADQRLIDYIKDNLQRGYSVNYLAHILIDQGWDLSELAEAVNVAQGQPHFQTQPQPEAAEHPPAARPSQQGGRPPRPTGITTLCILGFFGSALMLVAGVAIVLMGSLIGTIGSTGLFANQMLNITMGNETGMADATGIFPLIFGFLGVWLGIIGIIEIILAIVGLASYYLLWKMKKIGWIIVTAWMVMGLILMIVVVVVVVSSPLLIGLAAITPFGILYLLLLIFGLIFNILIIRYMFKKKKLFV